MTDEPGPDAVVIRFSPASAEGVLARAEREFRRSGRHRSSVFCDSAREGETDSEVIARLLDVADLHGMKADNNRTFWVCARAGDLVGAGFMFVKDRYEGEVAEHYSVELGVNPGIEDARRFVAHFDRRRRTDG